MNMHMDQQMVELRRADMMRKTAEFRRVRENGNEKRANGLHRPVLARLGRIMSRMGHTLQTRYDNRERKSEPYQYKSA